MRALHTGPSPHRLPLPPDLAVPVVIVGVVVFLLVAYHLYRHDDPFAGGDGG